MKEKSQFLSTPLSILLGSLVISVSILMHGGIVKVGGKITPVATPSPAAAAPVAPAQPAAPTITLDKIQALFNEKAIVFGDKNSKNLLVEIADPSCPYCHVAAGKNPELNKQIGSRFTLVSDGGTYVAPVLEMKKLVDQGKAALVWIYSPGHGNGELGTKALYCAYEKNKFWPVHDKLMSNTGYSMMNETVKNDKAKIGELTTFLADAMDAGELKSCLESGKYDSKISEDTAIAGSLGVNGTPGFFINTTNFAGAYSWKDMESALQ